MLKVATANTPITSLANGWNKVAADNAWSDKTRVTGGIRAFRKNFEYTSDLRL